MIYAWMVFVICTGGWTNGSPVNGAWQWDGALSKPGVLAVQQDARPVVEQGRPVGL